MKSWIALLLFFLTSSVQASVSISDRTGSYIDPAGYLFRDESGAVGPLNRYFKLDRPVLMAFVYFECPGACTLLLNELIKGLSPHVLLPGKDFEVVVISINPKDSAELALKKKNVYLNKYNGPDTASGWHFLTGAETDIQKLTRKMGFEFEVDASGAQFNHPSVLYFLTPDGVISGEMIGLSFQGKTIRELLVRARDRAMSSLIGKWSAYCYTFVPHVGILDRPSRWLMLLTLLALSGFATRFLHLQFKRRKKAS
jgi:protein SCO1/2